MGGYLAGVASARTPTIQGPQSSRALAKQYAEDALKPLLDDGRAKAIAVTVEQPHNGRLELLVEVTDVTGDRQVFRHLVRVI
ncbi:phage GP46 family protein [Pseudomonas aeruginosa]|uniref:phage GP46 family protein n=1 Tax=Pseudomonas aeruginosa TaxID=287 RepID=UPI0036EFBA1B